MPVIYLAIGAGALALLYAALLTMRILRSDAGTEAVQAIGRAIQEGAMAFLSREYRLLAGFVVLMFIVLAVFIDFDVLDKVPGDRESVPKTAIAYIAGALGSALAGFIGM
ncbi:sodium/proton-translocating pyrophosphatase, partial [Dehalococcoidia bacterium]|nr:sodium/proton-translocating pyrophosphatase [Dehalococcoidia bacterium]